MIEQEKQTHDLSREEKMLRGTAWLTFGNFAGRLLGAFYIIPWVIWMGKVAPQANALYGMGYSVYAIFLALSTSGLNTAVAKQIAKYNAMDEEEKGLSLVRQFIVLMLLSGALFALVLYLGAPLFSQLSGVDNTLVPVLRSLTLAVLVFPAMSVLRGVFQGYNNAKPNALSQLAEQIIRVVWMLMTAFYIMKLGSKDYVSAVTQSTFAAFVGMLASLGVLGYYLYQEGLWNKLLTAKNGTVSVATSLSLIKDMVKSAIPLILVGLAVQLYQLVDQVSFIRVMGWLTKESGDRLSVVYAYLSANPNKIIMLIVGVAVSIGDVGIPLLTESHHQEDKPGVARLMLNGFQMLLVFALPALMEAIILAEPLYVFFYGQSENLAVGLFIAILLQTLLQCFYFALYPMSYALDEMRQAIAAFVVGFGVKLVLQLPCLWLFKAYGPVVSTGLALLASSLLLYRHLKSVAQFNPRVLVRNSLLIALNTLIMSLAVIVVSWLLGRFIQPTGRMSALFYLVPSALVGLVVYGYLSLKTRSIDKLLGYRAETLRQKLWIK